MIIKMFLLLGVFSSSVTFALELNFLKSSVQYRDEEADVFGSKFRNGLDKARQILDRDQKCLVAIYRSPASPRHLKYLKDELPTLVTCIQDIEFSHGTIDEKSGCSLVRFNLSSGNYNVYFNKAFRTAFSDKPCDKGGFEEILKKKGWWAADAYQNSSVEQTIFTPPYDEEFEWRYILVFAKEKKYSNWFYEARDKVKKDGFKNKK